MVGIALRSLSALSLFRTVQLKHHANSPEMVSNADDYDARLVLANLVSS